jgi:hypothetical protein
MNVGTLRANHTVELFRQGPAMAQGMGLMKVGGTMELGGGRLFGSGGSTLTGSSQPKHFAIRRKIMLITLSKTHSRPIPVLSFPKQPNTMASIVVTNEAALSDWLHRRPRRHHLVFNLDGLTPEENNYWEKRINRLNTDCGCSIGAAALCVMAILYPSVLILGGHHKPGRLGLEAVIGIVFIMAFAGLGKSIGLLRSHRLLRSSLVSLTRLIRERQGCATREHRPKRVVDIDRSICAVEQGDGRGFFQPGKGE